MINDKHFVIEKIAIKTMISWDAKVFTMKKSAGLVLKNTEIDENNIYKEMALL